jgi:hypothetical protein
VPTDLSFAPLPADLVLPAWCDPARLAYSFELPEETPSNNVVKNLHWMAYRRMRQLWRVRVLSRGLAGTRPEAPLEQAALVVVRRCSGQLDWDNAYGGLKPVLDTLVVRSKRNPDGLGLVVDDSPRHMPYPPLVLQRPASPGAGSTHVAIFGLA